MPKKSILKPEEHTFVREKLKGKNNTKSAMVAKGTQDYNVAKTQGYRLAHKPEVQNAIQKALQEKNVTYERAVAAIDDGLDATKIATDKETGEQYETGYPDHSIRLKSADMALKLLQSKGKEETPDETNPLLKDALQKGNIKELQRIIFNEREPEQ